MGQVNGIIGEGHGHDQSCIRVRVPIGNCDRFLGVQDLDKGVKLLVIQLTTIGVRFMVGSSMSVMVLT
jgi:hypothetical protein